MRTRQFLALGILFFVSAAVAPAISQTLPSPAVQAPQPQAPVPGPTPQGPATSQPDPSRIPAITVTASALEASAAWRWEHDSDTKGWSTGQSNFPIYPDGPSGLPGRQFVASYGDNGGQRYHLNFGRDVDATHFIYEANVYLVDPGQIANVEMDMNQVMADDRTVIFGTQCSAHSKTWEYTYVNSTGTHWHPSNIHCNPHDWGAKKWHKVQIAFHRDADGNVTYDWIGFDGAYTNFQGAAVLSAESLHWARGDLLLNFQIDGAQKTGIMDAYLNNLAVYRW
jgi:hypothetical protein